MKKLIALLMVLFMLPTSMFATAEPAVPAVDVTVASMSLESIDQDVVEMLVKSVCPDCFMSDERAQLVKVVTELLLGIDFQAQFSHSEMARSFALLAKDTPLVDLSFQYDDERYTFTSSLFPTYGVVLPIDPRLGMDREMIEATLQGKSTLLEQLGTAFPHMTLETFTAIGQKLVSSFLGMMQVKIFEKATYADQEFMGALHFSFTQRDLANLVDIVITGLPNELHETMMIKSEWASVMADPTLDDEKVLFALNIFTDITNNAYYVTGSATDAFDFRAYVHQQNDDIFMDVFLENCFGVSTFTAEEQYLHFNFNGNKKHFNAVFAYCEGENTLRLNVEGAQDPAYKDAFIYILEAFSNDDGKLLLMLSIDTLPQLPIVKIADEEIVLDLLNTAETGAMSLEEFFPLFEQDLMMNGLPTLLTNGTEAFPELQNLFLGMAEGTQTP